MRNFMKYAKFGRGLRLGGGGVVGGLPTGPILVIAYGQSNTELMFTTSSSPPAALASTRFWNGTALVDVPNGNGIREFCNTLSTLTGRDVHVAEASTSGASSGFFIEGERGWDDFTDAFTGLGGVDLSFTIQGEGDADGSNVNRKSIFKANHNSISASMNALAGKTVPRIWGTLSTYGGLQATISDSEWWEIQEAIRELCDENAQMYMGASRMDAVRLDEFHADAVSHGRIGKRLAYEAARALGYNVGAAPTWYIASTLNTSTTTTRLAVVHSRGTDFTPTTGITGFEVSEDGTTWIAATGARFSATQIDLTHAALGATTDRFVRYQYGTLPDISGAVKDNSDLLLPLHLSAGQLLVDYALPVMTSPASVSTPENATYVQNLTSSRPSTFAIGGTDGALFEILAGDELHFIAEPDFEVPGDAGANNVYDITITPTAIDNGDVGAAQSVAVTVTNEGEGAGPTYSFLAAARSDASTATQTLSVAIGSASAGRYILVGLGVQNGDPDPTVTVGGVSLTKQVFSANTSRGTGFYGGLVTTGNGAQDVVVTWATGAFEQKIMAVWRIDDLASTTPKVAVSGTSNPTISVDAGDLVFYFFFDAASTGNMTLAAADQAPDRQAYFGSNAGFSADWTILSTDASFAFNETALTGGRAKISFA